MRKIVLPTNRPYNGKLFWVLLGLNTVAAFAIIPFGMNLQTAYSQPGTDNALSWGAVLADRFVTLIVIAILAGIGLALANRIGVGLPFLENRLKGESPPGRFRSIVAVGAIVGIGSALLILALDLGVFSAPMQSMIQELSLKAPEQAVASPFYGFLAAISAGINEETIFRLFGLSLLAWLGGMLFRTADGRPRLAVFWVANVLFAFAFGAAHLPTARALGWPMNTLVLSRTFLLNGTAGVAFGWLFWTYGLESAMLAHFFTDVGLYTLLPIIILQEGTTAKVLAGAGVAIVVALGLVWAGRTVAHERNTAGMDGPGSADSALVQSPNQNVRHSGPPSP